MTASVVCGQSSWLQIRRPGFDSRHYQKKKVAGLERGPLNRVSTTEELKLKTKTKLHGLRLRANYTDRATASYRRSDCQLLRIEGATW
jgi:hypothetical protein